MLEAAVPLAISQTALLPAKAQPRMRVYQEGEVRDPRKGRTDAESGHGSSTRLID